MLRSPGCFSPYVLTALLAAGWSASLTAFGASNCPLDSEQQDAEKTTAEVPMGQPEAMADFLPAEALRNVGLLKHWQLALPLGDEHRLADVYHVDDALYATTDTGWVFAIHADTGAMRWMRRITTRGNRLLKPAHKDNAVVFPAKSELVLYNRYTGDGIRRVELQFPCITSPVIDQGRIYLGSSNGRFYALDRRDYSENAKAMSEGPIVGSLVLDRGILYVPCEGGAIMAAWTGRWTPFWLKPAQVTGPLSADILVADEAVYVPSLSQSLFKLNRRNGHVLWRHPMSAPLTTSPVLTDKLLYQANTTDGLVALDPNETREADRIKWSLKRGTALCTVDDSFAYLLDKMGNVVVVRRENGEYVAEIPTPGLIEPHTLTSTEATALYLYDHAGHVFCAKPIALKPPSDAEVRMSSLPPAPEAKKAVAEPVASAAETPEASPKTERPQISGAAMGGSSKISREWGKSSD